MYGRDKNSLRVLQDFVPYGATSLLPLKFTLKMLKQGESIADHILPLGDLLNFSRSEMTLILKEVVVGCSLL